MSFADNAAVVLHVEQAYLASSVRVGTALTADELSHFRKGDVRRRARKQSGDGYLDLSVLGLLVIVR